MDQDVLILRTLGSAALYVGGAVLGVWVLGGIFALIDAWRTYEPPSPTRRK